MRVGKPLRSGWPPVATAFVAAALVTGCGGSKKAPPPDEPRVNVVQPGAPGEASRKVPAGKLTGAASVSHTQPDVEFMLGMIHHHQQAVVMTSWVPDRTRNTSVRVMAKRMGLSQEAEIELMQRWLKDRGVDPNDHTHRHALMPGMLTSEQLGRLRAAGDRAFDRLFLRYMTRHHRGALTMVRQLREKGGGAEPEIGAFTRHVDSDQQIEILRMQELLRG